MVPSVIQQLRNTIVVDYVDYDSDYEAKAEAGRGIPDIDPYAGMDPAFYLFIYI